MRDGFDAAGLPEHFTTKEHDDDRDELTQIREGINDFKVPSYFGPKPPVGEHNYEFRLYALDAYPKVPKKVLTHRYFFIFAFQSSSSIFRAESCQNLGEITIHVETVN